MVKPRHYHWLLWYLPGLALAIVALALPVPENTGAPHYEEWHAVRGICFVFGGVWVVVALLVRIVDRRREAEANHPPRGFEVMQRDKPPLP